MTPDNSVNTNLLLLQGAVNWELLAIIVSISVNINARNNILKPKLLYFCFLLKLSSWWLYNSWGKLPLPGLVVVILIMSFYNFCIINTKYFKSSRYPEVFVIHGILSCEVVFSFLSSYSLLNIFVFSVDMSSSSCFLYKAELQVYRTSCTQLHLLLIAQQIFYSINYSQKARECKQEEGEVELRSSTVQLFSRCEVFDENQWNNINNTL